LIRQGWLQDCLSQHLDLPNQHPTCIL
jgi:hypothetical protein